MVEFQCCSETVRPQLLLQEYLPVQLEWSRSKEIVRYLEYYNGSKSLVKMACNGKIKNMELRIVTDNERETIPCDLCLFIHEREVNIIFNKEYFKICQYIKNGRIQIGLNDHGGLEKIDIMDLSDEEIKHIKQELELQ